MGVDGKVAEQSEWMDGRMEEGRKVRTEEWIYV